MKETNLVLNVDTTKRHAKRLLKVLQNDTTLKLPESFKLAHSQEILAKSLGFNNWHELNQTFKEQQNTAILEVDKPDVTTSNSQDDISIIKNLVIQGLNLSDKDSYIYSRENLAENISISFDDIFSQYKLLPFLFCMVIYSHDNIKTFFHDNFLIHYQKNYHSQTYEIGFKQKHPEMIEHIALAIIELFNISLVKDKKVSHSRQFDFAKIENHYWNTEEKRLNFQRENLTSIPFYSGNVLDAKNQCQRYLQRSFLHGLDAYELTTIILKLAGEDTRVLIEPVVEAVFYMAEQCEVLLDMDMIREHLILDNIIKLAKGRRDFPTALNRSLKNYLFTLPGFDASDKQNDNAISCHGEMQLKLVRAINSLVNIEQEDVPIFKTEWWEFIQADSNISLPDYVKEVKVASKNYFKDIPYVNELWFDDVLDIRAHRGSKSFDRRFGFLFSTGKNVYMSDLVKSLYDISLNGHELALAQQFIFAYPRIKKISEKLQQVYRENKEY